MSRGKIVVLTAPSGSGKTSIAHTLLDRYSYLTFSISATTRPPRSGEVDGRDYHFLSHEEFKQKIEEGEFIEWQSFYNGQYYGTLHSEVDKQLNSGYFTLLDIDVKGALNVKGIYGDDSLTVFIRPPSLDTLKQRLANRGTENEDTLAMRLQRAEMEIKQANKFDHIIVNNNLHDAIDQAASIVDRYLK